MAYDNTMTVVGNLTRDPELRFTSGGVAVANFSVAWNMKGKDGQEDKVSYFDVTCWRGLAENVSDSLTKGMRVVVHGRLDQRSWENDQGEKRSKVEIVADDVSPSLKWATATVTRNERSGGGGYAGEPAPQGQPQGQPPAQPPAQGQPPAQPPAQGQYQNQGQPPAQPPAQGQYQNQAPQGGYQTSEEPF